MAPLGTASHDQLAACWTCPGCGRQFKRQPAEHTCQLFSLEQHYRGKPPAVVALCEAYLAAAAALGSDVSIEPLKTAIMLRTRTNFGSVRVRRSGLRCFLVMEGLPDDPRIVESVRYTARKLAVAFDLTAPDEIDLTVLGWLRAAYGLAT
jgi:hypothetical protein